MSVVKKGLPVPAARMSTRPFSKCRSARALAVATSRKTKVQSWYLDVNLLAGYWGQDRVYHHTAPISMNYALHEALRLVLEEGLTARFQRHESNHQALKAALDAMGLKIVSQAGYQLWQLNAVEVPAGVHEAVVRQRLLAEHGIELGAGLGPMKGKIWRIGLMGATSTRENVRTLGSAFSAVLTDAGYQHTSGLEQIPTTG